MGESMKRWRGKVAIVTGASSGIGKAIAEKLVEAGLQVAGFARRSELIEESAKKLQAKEGKLHAVKVDVTKEDDILKGFEWVSENLGPVSVLVNCAGVFHNTNLTEGSTELWKNVFDTNVLGLCIATREAVKIMKANKIDGQIIHMNCVSGHKVVPLPNMNVSSAAKHAVTALTETLRQEFNQLGLKIKITSISPGAVATEIYKNSGYADIPALAEAFKAMIWLQTEDVAEAVLYVLSTPSHVQVHELTIKPFGEMI